ncbi:pyruvate, phosphate dikinase, partial [bacterium]|nr:pyruvate, phosphate dikinase [bacterium]
IHTFLQNWIQDDKLNFMVHITDRNTSLLEVIDAIRRYANIVPEGIELSPTNKMGVTVALIRRIFSSQLSYINIAKNYIEISDYFDLVDRIIYASESQGKLGGKSAGLFLAKKILKKSANSSELLRDIKVPKSWHITSDVMHAFLRHNNLEDVVEQKYKDINQVRLEYPNIIQTMKNGCFPPEIVKGLSMLLDEFDDKPLIIRSSSLLEDSLGAAFSGKYKSLFLSNQGDKNKRLENLMDAIAEVYASTFGPDPIEYRVERGLIDFSEEMGIMIQEVIGTRVGDYYCPVFAGVAFSKNEFRWSPRIKYDDGLIRIVPGMGTRAVDRIGDDYPILIAAGQPGLRVNIKPEEVAYYSPKKVDVIDMKANTFKTIDVNSLLRMNGNEMPLINKVVSVFDGQHLRRPMTLNTNFEKDDLVVTFEGLINDSTFIKQLSGTMKLLEKTLGTPIDIEFAHDGKNLYLLQCRPQSHSKSDAPAPIPKDVSEEKIVFSASRYISNGYVPEITHIVYVDPQKYSELPDKSALLSVGLAVGQLNKLLPKNKFILMGPGRWGSRGDIRLGVNVTYSDISNTAVLIEIARKKGNYIPDLSFGIHFFQDLVEGHIRYLPLYPDDKDIIFNENFLKKSPNLLPNVLPEFAALADTVHLIDIPKTTEGQILQILMNAELNEALGILVKPGFAADEPADQKLVERNGIHSRNFWTWRLKMAKQIASQLDSERFGVEGFYVFGSTKNASAGVASDIDILIHFRGSDIQRKELLLWLEGWSLCLDEMNYIKTGYRSGGLIDTHIVTDEDIENRTSFAVKIGAITDAALLLPMMNKK